LKTSLDQVRSPGAAGSSSAKTSPETPRAVQEGLATAIGRLGVASRDALVDALRLEASAA